MELRGRPVGLILIVGYKAIWGALDVIAGAFVHKVPAMVKAKIAADPQDQLANWIMAHTSLVPAHIRVLTLALIAVGVVKIVLAGGIWYRSWLIRDIALWVMSIAGLIALVALLHHLSIWRVLALGIDVTIVWYLWRMLPRYLPARGRPAHAHARST
jgi:uncharacterized membrane protein